jgi:hypothetical protein
MVAFDFFSELENTHYVQKIWEKDWDGGCPCSAGEIMIGDHPYHIETNCWRVCEYDEVQDVRIYRTDKKLDELNHEELQEIGEFGWALVKALNKQEWYNPYRFLIKPKEVKDE